MMNSKVSNISTNLSVFFGRTIVNNNSKIEHNRLKYKLKISFNASDNEYYTIHLINIAIAEFYINRVNITSKYSGDSKTEEKTIEHSGQYEISLYKQLDAEKESGDSKDLELLEKIVFTVLPRISEYLVAPEVKDQNTRKYCSCILQVAQKSSINCLESLNDGTTGKLSGEKCYHPEDLCKRNFQPTEECKYLYERFSDIQLIKYALYKNINIANKERLTPKERSLIITQLEKL